MKNRKLFPAMAMLVFAAANAGLANAQTVTFAYDAAGNRVSRTIVLPKPAPPLAKSVDTEPFTEQLLQDLQVKIYPNPVRGLLRVELKGLEEDETAGITLYGTNGTVLLQTKATTSLTPVDMSAYPAGLYVLSLTIRGKPETYKIIKQ